MMPTINPLLWRGLLVVLASVTVGTWIGWLNRRANEPRITTGSRLADTLICQPLRGWVIFGSLVGAAMIIGGLWATIYLSLGFGGLHARWLLVVFASLNVLLGVYFIVGMFKYRVVLEPDAITLLGLFIDKHLGRDEIRGKRYTAGGGVKYVTLYPVVSEAVKRKRKIKIAFFYDRNAEIEKWVSDIPILGATSRTLS